VLRASRPKTWRKWLAVGLVGAAVVWIFVNKSVEGPVLLALGPHHGITVADLVSIALLIIAGLLVLPSRWRSVVTVVALAIVVAGLAMSQIMPERTGLATSQPTPAQAATYYWSRCGNTSGRVLLTLDDWADGDPYRATSFPR
jgi:hypothetical protein